MAGHGEAARRYGKSPRRLLEEIVYRNLGASSLKIEVGPRRGFDNAVISVAGGVRMIMTTDPVSMIPSMGPGLSAWLSVHLIASDYATSGRSPEFAAFDFNFPPEMSSKDRAAYLRETGRACAQLGVTVAGGHTGSYPGADYTVIGGGFMFGFARRNEYIDPSMSRIGDAVLMTKGAAIEATASLACAFPNHLAERVGKTLASRATRLVRSCSVVKDALTAARLGLGRGGVTSMHDATEGGVLGGLDEMAEASGNRFQIDLERVLLPPEVSGTCAVFGIDPLTSLSEGTLLATCDPSVVEDLIRSLKQAGIRGAVIGTVRKGRGVHLEGDGRTHRVRSKADGYWEAYDRASRAGLH